MSAARKQAIRRLLKGIETGDPDAVKVVNEAKYIQHNPQTHEGSEGLASLFARLAKTSPRVNVVRIFSDGDFVFGHTEYDFSTRRIGFEVFRFEGDQAVEHWDNIQLRRGPNPAGRSMVDGPIEATDLDATESNRARVRTLGEVLVSGELGPLEEFVDAALIQHDPNLIDGLEPWRAAIQQSVAYTKVHRILAEGSFVLSASEGSVNGEHSALYDLFRLEDGVVKERWNTVEHIAPRSEWKNNNGKF